MPTTPMTSSSSTRAGTPLQSKHPIPGYEKPLYDRFQALENTLLSMKNNRNKYIDSHKIYQLYDGFLNDLHELKLTRKDEELKGLTLAPNATDARVDDIWQLLSLCFMTCGLTKFAPATYASLSTVHKLLEHLKECQVYTYEDLQPIAERLEEMKTIISANSYDDEEIDEQVVAKNNIHKIEENLLLRTKLMKCVGLYKQLEDKFKNIPKELEGIYFTLVRTRKKILQGMTKSNQSDINEVISDAKADIAGVMKCRDEDGVFCEPTNEKESKATKEGNEEVNEENQELNEESEKPQVEQMNSSNNDETVCTACDKPEVNEEAQSILNGLLDDCNNLLNDLSFKTDDIASSFDTLTLSQTPLKLINKKFETLYHHLIEIKQTLENLLVTRRWTMRETDLYSYQKQLKSIDEERLELSQEILKFSGDEVVNQKLRKNQILILYLLRRCYALIYKLLESSEPVSESLQPIHNQLSTVRRCLLEIKRIDGLNNLRELYPFQFKLASLDNLRSDGKFIINNQIPEGQGTLNALLAECFDIIYELKIDLDERDESDVRESHGGDFTNARVSSIIHDLKEEDKSDDEVERKRNRYVGFHEADYDQDSEGFDEDDDYSFSEEEYEGNDYY